jgi:hypothetical protein
MDATVAIPLSVYTQLIERAARAEQQVAELQAKIVDLTLNPPRRPRKPSEPKVRTPEEEEALRIKRSEAGKKSAETRRLRKAAEAEARMLEERSALRAQIAAEMKEEQANSEVGSRLQAIFDAGNKLDVDEF